MLTPFRWLNHALSCGRATFFFASHLSVDAWGASAVWRLPWAAVGTRAPCRLRARFLLPGVCIQEPLRHVVALHVTLRAPARLSSTAASPRPRRRVFVLFLGDLASADPPPGRPWPPRLVQTLRLFLSRGLRAPRVLAVWPASSLAPWTGPPSELHQSPQPLRLLLPHGDPSPPPGEERAPQSPSLLPRRVCAVRVRAVRVPRGPWSRKRSSSQHKDGEMPAPAAGCS